MRATARRPTRVPATEAPVSIMVTEQQQNARYCPACAQKQLSASLSGSRPGDFGAIGTKHVNR